MKALIFAAGLGNRLKPLTDTTPKALLPVDGKPMLEHVILKLKDAGFDQITVNIHHFGQQIIDFLKEKNNFGIDIHISDEREYLLDTGGGIKHAAEFLDGDEPFMVHNVDIFSNVDFRELYKKHLESNALATLLVSKRKTSRYLLFNQEDKLCGWRNRETGEVIQNSIKNMHSAAFMSFPRIFFDGWRNGRESSRLSSSTCPFVHGHPSWHIMLPD